MKEKILVFTILMMLLSVSFLTGTEESSEKEVSGEIVVPEEEKEEIEVPEEKKEIVIKVQETEKVSLEITASDPDSDKLVYYYSYPLNEKGEWKTTYGDAGEYVVTVTVSDGELNISEEVLLIVERKEEIPTIDSFSPAEEEVNIVEGDSVNFLIIASDLNNDKLSYNWELDGEEVSTTNKFSYFADYKSSGSHLLRVLVSDSKLTITKSWRINVENFDRAPMFMPIPNILIKETQKITIYLNATDPDDDKVTYLAENLPEGSSLTGNVFSLVTNYDTVKKQGIIDEVLDKYHLVMDSYIITFIAKGSEKETRQKVRISVRDVNRKPVLSDIATIEVNEGDSFTIKATASDPDGDKLKFSYSGWINQDSYTTTYDDAGEHIVKVGVSDGWLTDSKDLKIIVKNKNRASVFKDISKQSVNEGELLKITLDAYDPDNDAIVFSAQNLTNSLLKDNVFEWTPGYDTVRKGSKDVSIKFTVSDGFETATKEAFVTVNDVDLAPKITEASPAKSVVVRRKEPVIFKIDAYDPDGDKLYYNWIFSMLEKYENYGNTIKRIFTTTGNKKVKVIISDGEKEITYEWDVKVT